MCAEMVRATLEDRKTQTRRVVKEQFHGCLTGDCPHECQSQCEVALAEICPYGGPGDKLWLRECFCGHWGTPPDGTTGWRRITSGRFKQRDGRMVNATEDNPVYCYYRATTPDVPFPHLRWKPNLHMPRCVCRLELQITDVRVERVRDISMADVLAEGCILSTSKTEPLDYQNLWNALNEKRGYGWDKNPWVWVITFKRL
jgi:hypothetical protein